jgi:hypothetical protein
MPAFILQERRKEKTELNHWLDILPKGFDEFPAQLTKDELKFLKGSPFLKSIAQRKEDIKTDYELICKKVPEFAQFPF